MRKLTRPYLGLLILSIGIGLTYWQIYRAMEKYQYLYTEKTEASLAHLSPNDHLAHISLSGTPNYDHIFIQPRSHHHQPGYQVWVPLSIGTHTLLVSYGFQKDLHIPNQSTISGTIHHIAHQPFRLSNILPHVSPYTVGQLDIPLFSQISNLDISPYVIVLDGCEDLTLADNSIDSILKHINYAGQFFLFSVILCYYVAMEKRETHADKES